MVTTSSGQGTARTGPLDNQRPAPSVPASAFRFRPLTEPDARRIATWRYSAPYDFYDLPEDSWPDLLGLGQDFQAADLATGTLVPVPRRDRRGPGRWLPAITRRALRRPNPFQPSRRIQSPTGAGFICFGAEAQVSGARDAGLYRAEALDIGLGLRPDLTGRGLGDAFVAACIDHALRTRQPAVLRLAVATFNARAIAVYERADFRTIGRCASPVRGRPVPFVVMTRTSAAFSETNQSEDVSVT